MKLINKIGLLSLSAVTMFSFSTQVKAGDQTCTKHRNYYLFNEINNMNKINTADPSGALINSGFYNKMKEIKDGTYEKLPRKTTHSTEFPSLDKKATKVTDPISICLTKGSEKDHERCTDEMTLEAYYDAYRKAFTNNKVYTEEKDGRINTYYLHGKWTAFDESGSSLPESNYTVDFVTGTNNADLVKASILPTNSVVVTPSTTGVTVGNVTRHLYSEDLASFNLDSDPATIHWTYADNPSNNRDLKSVFFPAITAIDYEVCEDNPKPTTPTPTNPKPTTPGKADIDITESPQTGSALIYVAWAVGLGALGYSAYYFYNTKKSKKKDI